MAGCERCAGYMVDVYARLTNTIGIVDAPGGIGSPWLLPALCEANNSSTPVLAIFSGVGTDEIEKWNTSECKQKEIFNSVCKKYLRIENETRTNDFIRLKNLIHLLHLQ